eukprot:7615434-Lingulodinium_polyedra.AAC.1
MEENLLATPSTSENDGQRQGASARSSAGAPWAAAGGKAAQPQARQGASARSSARASGRQGQAMDTSARSSARWPRHG